MKRIEIKNISDIMKAADIVIEKSAKVPGAEVWHPTLVWAAPTLLSAWDEVTSHAPKAVAIRVTTPFKVVTLRDIWRSEDLNVTYNTAFEVRLELLVARALKNLVGRGSAVIDIDVDWDSIVPVVVNAEEKRRRPRRPRR